jgi:glutamate/tyrosine decarboxylase-like PLP-dependent enzyme
MLAYREYYKKDRPNIVICKSAHVAFDKASHYLGIEVRRVG